MNSVKDIGYICSDQNLLINKLQYQPDPTWHPSIPRKQSPGQPLDSSGTAVGLLWDRSWTTLGLL